MGAEGDLAVARLARGCRCFAVWLDGSLGGYGWLSTGPEWIGEIELEIKPRPGEGYIWNCFTMPTQRREGVFTSLVRGISGHARDKGLKRVWIGSIDIPAVKVLGPSGFRPALHGTGIKLGALRVAWVRQASDKALAADATWVLGSRAGIHAQWGSHPRRH